MRLQRLGPEILLQVIDFGVIDLQIDRLRLLVQIGYPPVTPW